MYDVRVLGQKLMTFLLFMKTQEKRYFFLLSNQDRELHTEVVLSAQNEDHDPPVYRQWQETTNSNTLGLYNKTKDKKEAKRKKQQESCRCLTSRGWRGSKMDRKSAETLPTALMKNKNKRLINNISSQFPSVLVTVK